MRCWAKTALLVTVESSVVINERGGYDSMPDSGRREGQKKCYR